MKLMKQYEKGMVVTLSRDGESFRVDLDYPDGALTTRVFDNYDEADDYFSGLR